MIDRKLRLNQRYHLKRREVKDLLNRVQTTLRMDYSLFKESIEVVKINSKSLVFLIDGKPAFIDTDTEFFPSLLNTEILNQLPELSVDRGAVPHLCNGADLMLPGIVKVVGEFLIGEMAIVVDESFSKPLAVVKMLYNSNEMSNKQHGKVAKNIHYVGDIFWRAFKQIK